MFRRFAPAIGLVAALRPWPWCRRWRAPRPISTRARPPAEIFANDCAVCHKTHARAGQRQEQPDAFGFLREHYTASRDQAAALAAYVLGAGGNAPAPQAPAQKPGPEQAKAAVEEPKAGGARGQRRSQEPKRDDTASPPSRMRRPRATSETAELGADRKPTRPRRRPRRAKPAPSPSPAAGRRSRQPAADRETPASAEAPSPAHGPSQDASPTTSAAAPAESQPGDERARAARQYPGLNDLPS